MVRVVGVVLLRLGAAPDKSSRDMARPSAALVVWRVCWAAAAYLRVGVI